MKLGIDIHGVIDKRPDVFSKLSRIMKSNGHEVHILTGSKITDSLRKDLKKYDILYDSIFSILDFHSMEGTHMWQDSESNWWIDNDIWNKTKAQYCEVQKIDFHIDDTKIYGKYFKTPFTHFTVDGNIEIDSITIEMPFVKEVFKNLMEIDTHIKINIV